MPATFEATGRGLPCVGVRHSLYRFSPYPGTASSIMSLRCRRGGGVRVRRGRSPSRLRCCHVVVSAEAARAADGRHFAKTAGQSGVVSYRFLATSEAEVRPKLGEGPGQVVTLEPWRNWPGLSFHCPCRGSPPASPPHLGPLCPDKTCYGDRSRTSVSRPAASSLEARRGQGAPPAHLHNQRAIPSRLPSPDTAHYGGKRRHFTLRLRRPYRGVAARVGV